MRGKELCAFANSTGGKILIGVTDDGKRKELSDPNRPLSQVQDHARNCDPPISVAVELVDGVVMVDVQSSRDKPHSYRGLFYLREGANAQKMSRTQIREFFFKEGLIYFDTCIHPGFNPDTDISFEAWTQFVRMSKFLLGL